MPPPTRCTRMDWPARIGWALVGVSLAALFVAPSLQQRGLGFFLGLGVGALIWRRSTVVREAKRESAAREGEGTPREP